MELCLSAKIVAFYSGADNGSAVAVHLCTFGALFLHFYFTINNVDITVAVLIIMILLAGVIKIAPVFITKMTLNSYANELCREAEIAGRIGTETTARLDRLNESHPDLAPTVTWSVSGNIQIGRTFSVTVSTDYDFSFFVFNTAPITISATAEGTSEVFWK